MKVGFRAVAFVCCSIPLAHAETIGHLKALCTTTPNVCDAYLIGIHDGYNRSAIDQSTKNLSARGDSAAHPGYSLRLNAEIDRISGYCEPEGGTNTLNYAALTSMKMPGTIKSKDEDATAWVIRQWQETYGQPHCVNAAH